MKALTICQPYAHLIVTPADELPAGHVPKRVENRTWFTPFRGQFLVHAGLSREWLPAEKSECIPGMVFGAILGVAELVTCIRVEQVQTGHYKKHDIVGGFEWLETHPHVEGPYLWILQNVSRFKEPIPYKGAQGIFEVPGITSIAGSAEE